MKFVNLPVIVDYVANKLDPPCTMGFNEHMSFMSLKYTEHGASVQVVVAACNHSNLSECTI